MAEQASVGPEPEEVEIPVPWGHISGRWWGPRDVQPVLGLHGWQDNAGTWDQLAPLITNSGDRALLSLDLVGHGRSSHFPKGQFYHLYWDGVMMLRRVCRHFGWNKDVQLIGHSLGGAIAFLYAACYPDQVRSLISVDIAAPVLRPDERVASLSGSTVDKFLDYEDVLDASLPNYTFEEAAKLVMDAYKGSLTRQSCDVLLRRGLVASEDGNGFYFSRDVRLKLFGLGHIPRATILAFCARVTCHVLNIKGKPGNIFDEEAFYFEVIEAMRPSAKSVTLLEIEGTHHLHLNTPERLAPHVSSFLSQ